MIAIGVFAFFLFVNQQVVKPEMNFKCVAETPRRARGEKVLITGAAGFIGSHIAQHCVNLGFQVICYNV